MFRHQGAITRRFINNESSYVQQVFQALFALISIIKITNLKMLQLHITRQHTVATTTTTTTQRSDSSLTQLQPFFFLGCAHKRPYKYTIQRDFVLKSCASTSICTQRTQSLESRENVQRSQTAVKNPAQNAAAFLETHSRKSCGKLGR